MTPIVVSLERIPLRSFLIDLLFRQQRIFLEKIEFEKRYQGVRHQRVLRYTFIVLVAKSLYMSQFSSIKHAVYFCLRYWIILARAALSLRFPPQRDSLDYHKASGDEAGRFFQGLAALLSHDPKELQRDPRVLVIRRPLSKFPQHVITPIAFEEWSDLPERRWVYFNGTIARCSHGSITLATYEISPGQNFKERWVDKLVFL